MQDINNTQFFKVEKAPELQVSDVKLYIRL